MSSHRTTAAWVAVFIAIVAAFGVTEIAAGGGRAEPQHALTNPELADALGNQHGGFVTTTVQCVAATGTYSTFGSYDHRCRREHYDGIFCLPGTGVSVEMVYVRVHGRHYRIVATPNVGRYVTCESTA